MALAQHDSFEGPQSETPGPTAPQLGGLASLAPPEEPTPDDVDVEVEPPPPPHAIADTNV